MVPFFRPFWKSSPIALPVTSSIQRRSSSSRRGSYFCAICGTQRSGADATLLQRRAVKHYTYTTDNEHLGNNLNKHLSSKHVYTSNITHLCKIGNNHLCISGNKHFFCYISYFADTFIQSNLQLIRLSRGQSPLEQCGVKGLVQGPNGCADLSMATPGIEPPTLRVPVM